MKKTILIIIFIVSAIFIYGCGDGEEDTSLTSPFIGGSQGVLAEFEPLSIEENGIYTIYNDETFPIQIILKNKGEEDVETGDAKVRIDGILLDDFSGIAGQELTNDEVIEKISDVNEQGGEVIINFGDDVQYLPEIQGDFIPAEIYATYEYKYKTKASVPRVCFKEDLRDAGVCEVDSTKSVYSSAAPIQVKTATEKPAAAGKVSLSFDIENVGGGQATVVGGEFNTRYDSVSYKIVPETEANKWKCSAAGRENEARFSDKQAKIVCTLKDPLEEGAKYTREVVLEIEYEYRNVITESLRVKKSI